ncbi:MAG: hypothetical protein N2260_09360 [Syntrophobacterales bacterium]|nr:hypothetical protein [Syntrophobacterales bacterium]
MSEPKTLLRIHNSKDPTQMVEVVWDEENSFFVTKGLRDLFHIKEIRIRSDDFLSRIEEYARVIGWLLETMSQAEDLHLPFGYESHFTVGGKEYDLTDDGDYKLLTPKIPERL